MLDLGVSDEVGLLACRVVALGAGVAHLLVNVLNVVLEVGLLTGHVVASVARIGHPLVFGLLVLVQGRVGRL